MSDPIITVVLEHLALILRHVADQKVRPVLGVKKAVQKINNNLESIQGVVEDAGMKQLQLATVRNWVNKLKDTAYEIEDVLDKWNTAILISEFEKEERKAENSFVQKKVWSFIPSPRLSFDRVILHFDVGFRIKELNQRLDEIASEKNKYNFNETKVTHEPERKITSTSFVDVSEVCGRDNDKNILIELLSGSSQEEESAPHIISLVGMPGIGKTTLAQLMYNLVKDNFEIRIWVCVSDPFDEIKIAKAILESLNGFAPNLVELESLLQGIDEYIKGKKFLLVLDDVWTEDSTMWNRLKWPFEHGARGSRILVTTRKEGVSTMMGVRQTIRLRELSRQDCWSILSKVAFSGRTSKECENLEEIGRKIADKCNGLPLAAITVGSLMCFKKTKEQWQNVLNSEVWDMEGAKESLFPPLLLSYYDLPSMMRYCFLYCAAFPKDYVFNRDYLVELWMAQGYLGSNGDVETEIKGQEYFESLAMRSFFQDFEKDKDNGSVKRCKMHDLVHDFAQSLTKNESFIVEFDGVKQLRRDISLKKARHSTLMFEGKTQFPVSIFKAEKLRSLLCKSTWKSGIPAVQSDLFQHLTCLRALDLSHSSTEELPKEIGKFMHLRYLSLYNNSLLKELPETVCTLFNLQTLHLNSCSRLQKLPQGMGKLINLRRLSCADTRIRAFPKGIGRLCSLRLLRRFFVCGGNDKEACTLGDLRNLNKLRGQLRIEGLGNVTDACEAEKAELKKKECLLDLQLCFNGEGEDQSVHDVLLNALEPHINLENLRIDLYKGSTLSPNWIVSLTNLKRFSLYNCQTLELLPTLGKLQSLESLCILSAGSVKNIGLELLGVESDNNTNSSNGSFFPKLKELWFQDMEEWEEWNGISGSTAQVENLIIMPHLHSLRIERCSKLKSLPNYLQRTPVQEFIIKFCPTLGQCCQQGGGEEWSKISHIPNIKIDDQCVQRHSHEVEIVLVLLLGIETMQSLIHLQQAHMMVYHKNLVYLIGYCDEGENKALIYEYMANGNLHQYLSGASTKILTWEERLQIALDAAQGLEYLHNGCREPIVHRDVKTSNILLDEKWKAKLANFGQSRAFPTESASHVSTGPKGSLGYLDPEYSVTRKLDKASDIYSFGVILLELVTGQPAIITEEYSLIHISQWVNALYDQGNIGSMVDPRLQGTYYNTDSAKKVLETAIDILKLPASQRPEISKVCYDLMDAERSQKMESEKTSSSIVSSGIFSWLGK